MKQPNIEPIGIKTYRLTDDYLVKFQHPTTGAVYKFIIKEGFEYDGATVLPIFTWLSRGRHNIDGLNRAAALVHDKLYREKGVLPLNATKLTRKEIDQIFLQHLLESGVDQKTASEQYKFVRAFAWIRWFQYTGGFS